ncbi:MAG: hypothetical protein PHT19_11375 [Methylococcus sp.]|nr:hypothetical protein [Methylococcus sp.]
MNTRGSCRLWSVWGWVLSVFLSAAFGAELEETTGEPANTPKPWAINLSLYMWFPGMNGSFSEGRHSASVDYSFLDIAGKLRNLPAAFMGRLEANYERLGLYLDGNYMQMDFRPRVDGGVSKGLSIELGIMDYGATYRLFGPTRSERMQQWTEKSKSNILDVYLGGRTIWLGNQIQLRGLPSPTASQTLTAPVLGGRILVEFSPEWFVLMDGNAGGFGADSVSFTGTLMGLIGYRTTLLDQPASIEAGFKALRVDVSKPGFETNATMSGPFLGMSHFW